MRMLGDAFGCHMARSSFDDVFRAVNVEAMVKFCIGTDVLMWPYSELKEQESYMWITK